MTDEGFVRPCVGSCTTVCGWLRFNEVLGKNYIGIFVSLHFCFVTSLFITTKSYDIVGVATQVTACPSVWLVQGWDNRLLTGKPWIFHGCSSLFSSLWDI